MCIIRQNKLNRIIIKLLILNISLIFTALLYGIFGGSGGETTESVFNTITYTGIFSILGLILISIFNFKTILKNWHWTLLIILISILEIKILF